MKRTHHLYYLLLTLLFLTGCNDPKHVTDALTRAEVLMNEHPDSAWTVLNAISPDEMGQNRTRARYALLYTQAQDKTYRDETNDSLISVAVDYYRDTDDVRRKFLSYYYKGRVMMNAGESIKAMLSFLEAENLCKKVNDGYFLGLLYTQMGDIYKNYYDYTRSLEMYKKATACYEQSGKDLHRLYSLVDQASAYKNLGKNDESYRLHQIVLDEGTRKGYRRLTELCLGDLTMLCLKMKKLDEADLFIRELQQHYDISAMSSSFLADVAEIHAIRKEWNLAQEVLQQAWQRAQTENDTIVLYFTEARIHEIRTPQSDIYYSMLEGLKKQAGSIRRSMEQPVLTVQNDLLTTKLEYHQYKLRVERVQRWAMLLLVVIASVVFIYGGQKWLRKLYRKRIREQLRKKEASHLLDLECLRKEMAVKDANINNLIEEFNRKIDAKDSNFRRVLVNLENELASKNQLYDVYVQQTEVLRNDKEFYLAKLNLLFGERIELIDEIIRLQHSDLGSDKARKNALNDTVEEYARKVIKSRNFYKDLEEWVNISNQDVMNRLRSEVKLPDEDSYRQVCCHIAGYSVYGISVLMNETRNKIYKRRDRIRKKIEELSPKSMELFIECLSK